IEAASWRCRTASCSMAGTPPEHAQVPQATRNFARARMRRSAASSRAFPTEPSTKAMSSGPVSSFTEEPPRKSANSTAPTSESSSSSQLSMTICSPQHPLNPNIPIRGFMTLLHNLREVHRVPVCEHRAVNARVLVANRAVPALADAAFHAAFETHEDPVLREVSREQLAQHEAVH